MNADLRNSVWNVTKLFLINGLSNNRQWLDDCPKLKKLAVHLYVNFFKRPLNDLDGYIEFFEMDVKKTFDFGLWDEVYDLIEELAAWALENLENGGRLASAYNKMFERENSAYRFVNGQLVEITSQHEIEEIERTFEHEDRYIHVKEHLNQALVLLSKRENPDYRNSIKESISAVESLVGLVVGQKGPLGQLLKLLEKKGLLPAPLKNAYSSIYGYTCDGDGIRHALTNESKLSYAEARYMLISCSAFINYIIEREADIVQ